MIRLVHHNNHNNHKKHRKVWHLILAILVAGMPLGMWTPCACCDSAQSGAGELRASCCASEQSCCQTATAATATGCCKTRTTPCGAADPCCCSDTPPRQPLTPDTRDDFPVRQSMVVAVGTAADSILSEERGHGRPCSDSFPNSPLRLHAVLGGWLN